MAVTTMHSLVTRKPLVSDELVSDKLDVSGFCRDVVAGLSRTPRELPSKYLHDTRGSELFDLVGELPGYYPSRAETAIVREFADNIIEHIGRRITLIELGGTGNNWTRLLLDRLDPSSVYAPVNHSADHLAHTAEFVGRSCGHIDVMPIDADFNEDFAVNLPKSSPPGRVVYLPGGTIGNFKSGDARRLFRRIAQLCGTCGRLLVSIDLAKDAATVKAAFNDSAGVMAEFNLNVLMRINRELQGDFDLDAFAHEAVYDAAERRLEMRLVSKWPQAATVRGREFNFAQGEFITTLYHHLFPIDSFARLAKAAGFAPEWCWFDEHEHVGLMCLECES